METPPGRRPAPTDVSTGTELRRWYWLRSELVELARHLGVGTAGGKLELTERVAAHLDGRPVPRRGSPRAPAAPQLTGELTRATVIPPGQRSSQALRAFLTAEIGPGFRFDGAMRDFVSSGGGRTLGDAIEHWHATRGAATGDIAPQFELNRFVRAWHRDHPAGSRREALQAWAHHRSLPVEERE